MSDAVVATRELAEFLRSRRARLDPDELGLPRGRRARRTPGLRREEVAELAGVSVDYVVRLEQARGLRPSADVVEALARALRLTPSERSYLFDLAKQRPRISDKAATTSAPSLARLVDDLAPLPAMVTNHRYDILAWNNEMATLLVDFATLPPRQRNSMWLCLAHPVVGNYYLDRERTTREAIAHLRTAWAAHPDDENLAELIAEFNRDERFATLWSERDVEVKGRGTKVISHPVVGPITVEFETLTALQDPDQYLVIHRAADGESQSRLDALFAC